VHNVPFRGQDIIILAADIYMVSQQNVPVYFCSVSVKYEQISINIVVHVPEYNKTVQKVPTSPKICASTTLRNLR